MCSYNEKRSITGHFLFLLYIYIFLYFLNKNDLLFKDKEKIISDSTLVAITLLLAESKPVEKEIMINVIMNFLDW